MQFDLTQRRLALLVVDMQWVFLAKDGPFANEGSDRVVEGVNEVAGLCRSAGVPVLFSRYALRDDLRDVGLLAGMPAVEEGHLCVSSPSSAMDPRLDVRDEDVILTHHRPSAFFSSDLDAVLGSLGATGLVLAGISLNNAVGATARDAFARDLPVLIAREAVAAAPFESHSDIYLQTLDQWTAQVVDLAELRDMLPA